MIEKGSTYVVMGLLNTDSIAYAAGKMIEELGGNVIYTVQSERMKRIFFDRSTDLTEEQKAAMRFEYCDVTIESEVRDLFAKTGPINGVLHSIGFANPKTCLGASMYTPAFEDIKQAFHISCASLATVSHFALEQMEKGGSIVTLSFESQVAFPYYNWMGVNKAALEALVRGLARRHEKDLIRINAISAGPLVTTRSGLAASSSATVAANSTPRRTRISSAKPRVSRSSAVTSRRQIASSSGT